MPIIPIVSEGFPNNDTFVASVEVSSDVCLGISIFDGYV